jgi:tripartite-type tricarboxylate transporter receptor subunit TctC
MSVLHSKILRRTVVGAATFLIGCSGAAFAQDNYPANPIRLIVSFAPGGSTDLVGRLIAEYLGKSLNQTVVVENKGGAGGALGAEQIARAKPDGYTLGMATVSTHGSNPAIYSNLKYDARSDFAPISNIMGVPSVFAVHPSVPAQDMKAFIELHVPYRGAGPALNDALAGQVNAITDNLSSTLPHLLEGRLRPLAVLGAERSDKLPDVPTYSELGFEEMGTGGWFGLVAPAGTPQAIIDKLNAAVHQAAQDPSFKEKAEGIGATLRVNSPEGFAKDIDDAIERYTRVAKAANIQSN